MKAHRHPISNRISLNRPGQMTHARGQGSQLDTVGGPGGHKASSSQLALVALFEACKLNKTTLVYVKSCIRYRDSRAHGGGSNA